MFLIEIAFVFGKYDLMMLQIPKNEHFQFIL